MPHTLSRSTRSHVPALALLALALCSASALAQPKPGDAPSGDRRGPSAEALAACIALKAGDACSFTDDRGAASGSCWAPEGRLLACRPKDAPAPGGNAPESTKQ
ncbi:MAG: hypothetical protein IH605_17245 [Burkholderiales bacterium]|nr:hypothetical protein [Burkholderiales bacterium]